MPVVVPPSVAAAAVSTTTSISGAPPPLTYLDAYRSIVRRSRSSISSSASRVVILASAVDADAVLASRVLVSLLRQDDVPHTVVPVTGYAELARKRRQLFGRRRAGGGRDGSDDDDDDDDSSDGDDGDDHDGDDRANRLSRRSAGGGESSAQDPPQTLILLSLGSLLPLGSYFPIHRHSSSSSPCHIHLIDSHRPYNLDNLFGPAVIDGLGANGSKERGDTARIWVWQDGVSLGQQMEGVRASYEALEVSQWSRREEDLAPRVRAGG